MCSLGVQMGDEVMYIASAEAQQDLMLSFRAGRKVPLYCTSRGRHFLAQLSDEELRTYLQGSRRKAHTSFTRTTAQHIMSDIRAARVQGYAISNQEYMLNIVRAAVPVATPEGKPLAALSVSALNVRASLDHLRAFVPQPQRAAAELAACLIRRGKRQPEVNRPKRSFGRKAPRRRPGRRASGTATIGLPRRIGRAPSRPIGASPRESSTVAVDVRSRRLTSRRCRQGNEPGVTRHA
jgi:hypothetical protein